MNLSTICFLSFLASTFFLYKFSRHSRFLAQKWKLTPEEYEHYQSLARSALICAGVMMAVCVISLIAATILYFIGR